ncbi:energy-coupling factor ABC transporter substrate-binding protein [Streptomyces lavendofoliae]|uniref:Cobalt transport protein CbiN n=1 Tax=Streptomyces lavendofoliae TaxID=67314 RepID=A0A918HYJ4_9ACTN|nr:energy-coupling factor ABC transporter substrate-binding protein [Streptomyces lavendofoliae]GGU39341.1 hypothetical protein GCM10010274_28540 [Streptomyces lavendofoliae]
MSRNARINTLLLLVVVALAVLPLALGMGDHKEEPFTGADSQAETAITETHPDYEPWFSPLYEPPSGEIESALFSLQAALGAGVLAYYFGLRRGRRQGEARAQAAPPAGDRPDPGLPDAKPSDGGVPDGEVPAAQPSDAGRPVAKAGSGPAGTEAGSPRTPA